MEDLATKNTLNINFFEKNIKDQGKFAIDNEDSALLLIALGSKNLTFEELLLIDATFTSHSINIRHNASDYLSIKLIKERLSVLSNETTEESQMQLLRNIYNELSSLPKNNNESKEKISKLQYEVKNLISTINTKINSQDTKVFEEHDNELKTFNENKLVRQSSLNGILENKKSNNNQSLRVRCANEISINSKTIAKYDKNPILKSVGAVNFLDQQNDLYGKEKTSLLNKTSPIHVEFNGLKWFSKNGIEDFRMAFLLLETPAKINEYIVALEGYVKSLESYCASLNEKLNELSISCNGKEKALTIANFIRDRIINSNNNKFSEFLLENLANNYFDEIRHNEFDDGYYKKILKNSLNSNLIKGQTIFSLMSSRYEECDIGIINDLLDYVAEKVLNINFKTASILHMRKIILILTFNNASFQYCSSKKDNKNKKTIEQKLESCRYQELNILPKESVILMQKEIIETIFVNVKFSIGEIEFLLTDLTIKNDFNDINSIEIYTKIGSVEHRKLAADIQEYIKFILYEIIYNENYEKGVLEELIARFLTNVDIPKDTVAKAGRGMIRDMGTWKWLMLYHISRLLHMNSDILLPAYSDEEVVQSDTSTAEKLKHRAGYIFQHQGDILRDQKDVLFELLEALRCLDSAIKYGDNKSLVNYAHKLQANRGKSTVYYWKRLIKIFEYYIRQDPCHRNHFITLAGYSRNFSQDMARKNESGNIVEMNTVDDSTGYDAGAADPKKKDVDSSVKTEVVKTEQIDLTIQTANKAEEEKKEAIQIAEDKLNKVEKKLVENIIKRINANDYFMHDLNEDKDDLSTKAYNKIKAYIEEKEKVDKDKADDTAGKYKPSNTLVAHQRDESLARQVSAEIDGHSKDELTASKSSQVNAGGQG